MGSTLAAHRQRSPHRRVPTFAQGSPQPDRRACQGEAASLARAGGLVGGRARWLRMAGPDPLAAFLQQRAAAGRDALRGDWGPRPASALMGWELPAVALAREEQRTKAGPHPRAALLGDTDGRLAARGACRVSRGSAGPLGARGGERAAGAARGGGAPDSSRPSLRSCTPSTRRRRRKGPLRKRGGVWFRAVQAHGGSRGPRDGLVGLYCLTSLCYERWINVKTGSSARAPPLSQELCGSNVAGGAAGLSE